MLRQQLATHPFHSLEAYTSSCFAVHKLTLAHVFSALNKNKLKPSFWVPYLFPTPLNGADVGRNYPDTVDLVQNMEINSVKVLKGADATFYDLRGSDGVLAINKKACEFPTDLFVL